MAGRARLRRRAGPVPARARAHLRHGVPRRRPAIPAAPRRARAPPRAALPRRGALRERAEPLPPPLLRPALRRRRLDRSRARARRPDRPHRSRAAPGGHARVARALGALPLDREYRPDLLLVRLGDAAPRSGLPRDLPRQRDDRDAAPARRARAVAPVPCRVRRGPDQDAGRSVLARSDVSLLPPRDAAHAEPPVLALPPPAEAFPSPRGARQPRRAARRAVPALLSAADRVARGTGDRRDAGLAAAQRELLLAEPHHDRPRRDGIRRRNARPRRSAGAGLAARTGALARRRRDRRDRDHRRPLVPTRAQPRLAPPAHELVVRSAAPREHLWRVRQHHTRALRDRDRGDGRSGAHAIDALARVRVQGKAGRHPPAAAAVRAVPPPPRLAHVVRRDVLARVPRVVPAVPAALARGGPADARPAGQRSLRRGRASVRPRAPLSLPLHDAGGAEGGPRVVVAAARRRVRTAAFARAAPRPLGQGAPQRGTRRVVAAHAVHARARRRRRGAEIDVASGGRVRSEEHTSELQSQSNLVCRLLL